MRKKLSSTKVTDLGGNVSLFSRADKYWRSQGIKPFYKKFRPGLNLDEITDLLDGEETVLKRFSLKGIEFGNWVTNEDRVNYIAASIISLYDLNKILKFNNNLGLDKTLSLAFGSRGQGMASAHFEPANWVINITRYNKDTTRENKEYNFLYSGGVGALAHEYGHFLDYFFGTFIDQNKSRRSLSLGHFTTTQIDVTSEKGELRQAMAKVIEAIIYKKPGQKSNYYKRLEKVVSGSEYYFRHNELFARAFEQYVSYLLNRNGINNKFLSQEKYSSAVYMKQGDLLRVIPLIDALVYKMRKVL